VEPRIPAAQNAHPTRRPVARANSLVLVTAILVLLVIIATAFLVRSQGGRAQAAAAQATSGRQSRAESIALDLAQEVAEALFVKRIDTNRMGAQVTANQSTGLTGAPGLGEFVARSDFPRLPAEPLAIRYGVDYFDFFDNRTLGPDPAGNPAAATQDGYLDGYNHAPYSVNPFTNWPDRFGPVAGEDNPVGNPGFGDARWLASTEPVRARVMQQFENQVAPAPPNERQALPFSQDWSNLALRPFGPGVNDRSAMLDPAGLGFSHWPHLSWIATAENGFRVAWNIASLEGYGAGQGSDFMGSEPGVLTGTPGTAGGELALGVPYEQWLPWVAPREAALLAKDPQTGYLVLDPADWRNRVRQWFNVGVGALTLANRSTYEQIVRGVAADGSALPGQGGAQRRAFAMPNFLQLGAFGTPADEFGVYTQRDQAQGLIPQGYAVGNPKPRNLISRTLADADGDGWTDSFWFLAPASSDRGTRQIVAARIIDNSALINVNVATRFDRGNTIGQTPSDVALVTRRESYDETGGQNTPDSRAAFRDAIVGFFNARENDPEYRSNFDFKTLLPAPAAGPTAQAPARLVYAVASNAAGAPTGGVDVGWSPDRWEGRRLQPANAGTTAADTYQPGFLGALGLISEGAAGQENRAIPFFDRSSEAGLSGGTPVYGEKFLLTRPSDRINYFKAMSAEGEVIDPITAARITTLTPFSSDDEVELRAANGQNSPQVVSRLENALNVSGPITASDMLFGQFMRSTRSREETSRFYDPDDVRVQDWRARSVWNGNAAGFGPAARSGAELLLDHRRLMTTVSGARNEMLPPRLWSIRDHSLHVPQVPDEFFRGDDVLGAVPAYLGRGIDRDGDATPDDLNGDGAVTPADDLAPYHPNVMYTNGAHPLIEPNPVLNPFGFPIRDAKVDGKITVDDFELARRRFLTDNRKVDLRQPVDPPVQTGVDAARPATPVERLQGKVAHINDTQRVLRRALTDVPSKQSYFGRPGQSATEGGEALQATRLMAASLAVNMESWRDGVEPIASTAGASVATTPRVDAPFHPADAPAIPNDSHDGSLAGARFIGVEKQPFIMEVFLAFVYPKTKLEQSDIDQVVDPDGDGLPNNGCPDPATCQVSTTNPYALPDCTINGAGENFVVFDPADPNTRPAVVFAVQIANPYNEPVNLADFEIRVNPRTGAAQRFQFLRPSPAGSVSGNPYGPDVQLGPCTPEEPRTAIVFSIPEKFPNGDKFPRDAWLDFLDIRASIDIPASAGGVGDGTISAAEGDPNDDTLPGQPFPPDDRALFQPAWGPNFDDYKRSGTLLFDATTRLTAPTYAGFDVSGDIDRWRPPLVTEVSPPSAPPTSFIELARLARPVSAGSAPVWVTVDRFDNHLDTDLDSQSGQRFSDQVERLFVDGSGGALPPPPQIQCRPGGLAIDGIRLRTQEYYVAWARSARQWLFDTDNGVQLPGGQAPPGRGRITVDERAPRWVFARQTGTMSSAHPTQGAPAQDTYVGGVVDPSGRRGHVSSRTTHPDAPDGAQNLPIYAQYVNMWGEQRRGKPTFFPTRIYEGRSDTAPQERRYDYPAWGVQHGDIDPNTTAEALSFGEKGVTDPRFVSGADRNNFTAPLRMFQKDGDFDQVAEILDVPVWGPLFPNTGTGTGPGATVRAFATLPEILAQPANSSANLRFPKFPVPVLPPDDVPAYGPYPAALNRLILEPAQYDVTTPAGGRAALLSGVQALPPVVPAGAAASVPAQQGGIGFNSSLAGGAALLDAFTIDDRGAGTLLDATTDAITADGQITFQERAEAEDRRFRLAAGYRGKLTPGLININTAPIEVLRAMPQMLRLVYDDDFPILRGALSDPSQLLVGTSDLGRRRAVRDPLYGAAELPGLWDRPAQDIGAQSGLPGPTNPASILFDYGTPAPRVRIAESIELWRNKGNVLPDLGNNEFTEMPSYFSRGVDLQPDSVNHREWAPDSRGERGFDSVGELALLTRGAEFTPGTVDSDADGEPDVVEILKRTAVDANRNNIDDRADDQEQVGRSWNQAMSWSVRFAGLDPFRTQWARDDWGGGWRTRYLQGIPPAPAANAPLQKFTDGIPRNSSTGTAGPQEFPLSGRTAIDKHLVTVARDDRTTATEVETNDPSNDVLNNGGTAYTERRTLRYDRTAGDVVEQNQLLKGISNIATTRSDVFTVWLRIRTIKQDRLTGQWNGTDPSLIVDDSRYLMTIDRSSVDRPGERPRIINFVKVPN
jgi:hypothetical protein